MNCYVINLDRSNDRLFRIREEFDRINLKFIRVPAVDGRMLSQEKFNEHAKLRNLSRPQVGVILSHQLCWRLFKESDEEYCAIFEDDIHLSRELPELLDEIEKSELGFSILKIETARKKILISKKSFFDILYRQVRKIGSYHVGAAGYVLHKSFSNQFNQHHSIANTVPLDEFLFKYMISKTTVFQLDPAAVIQDQAEGVKEQVNIESLIADNRQKKYHKRTSQKIVNELKRPIINLLRVRLGFSLFKYKRVKISFK